MKITVRVKGDDITLKGSRRDPIFRNAIKRLKKDLKAAGRNQECDEITASGADEPPPIDPGGED